MGENNLLRNGKCGKCSTLMMMDDGSDVMEQMTDDDGPIASAFIIIQVSLFVIHRRHSL
jgi:hypothetical protein